MVPYRISVAPEAAYSIQEQVEGTLRVMAVSAQKALQGSKFDIRELLRGTEGNVSPGRGN